MFLVRWTYRLLAVLSLVLLVGVIALWIHSRNWVHHYVYWTGDRTHCTGYWLITSPGSIGVHTDRYDYPADQYEAFIERGCRGKRIPYAHTNHIPAAAFGPNASFDRISWNDKFGTISDSGRDSWNITGLTFRRSGVRAPTSFAALVLAVLPAAGAVRVVRAWRRRRRAPHLCPSCRYDLRATPAADGPLLSRCPECAHIPRTAQPVAPDVR